MQESRRWRNKMEYKAINFLLGIALTLLIVPLSYLISIIIGAIVDYFKGK
jgi:ABC-type amino acid transport system permease subunit